MLLGREFVRAVVVAGFAPKSVAGTGGFSRASGQPAPVPWAQGLNPKTPLPHTEVADGIAEAERRFFTPVQDGDADDDFCDVLMPPIGRQAGRATGGDSACFFE